MRLSRLSNRQLRRLLAHGEVRFAFDVTDTIRSLKLVYANMKSFGKDLDKFFSSATYRTEVPNDLKELQGTETLKKYEQFKSNAWKLVQEMKRVSDFANREAQKYQRQRSKY